MERDIIHDAVMRQFGKRILFNGLVLVTVRYPRFQVEL